MSLGTETPAAAASLLALGIDGIGLNCAAWSGRPSAPYFRPMPSARPAL
jgi:methionine synthase I (cobalamin-dependent)